MYPSLNADLEEKQDGATIKHRHKPFRRTGRIRQDYRLDSDGTLNFYTCSATLAFKSFIFNLIWSKVVYCITIRQDSSQITTKRDKDK